MKRLTVVLATVASLIVALLATAGTASAHGTQWTYYYGNVNGTYPVSATISFDRSLSWTVESYTVNDIIGSCTDSKLVFQSDGNLVMYYRHSDTGGCVGAFRVFWATNTEGNYHSTLKFQPDGNVVIYRSDGSVAYAAGTNRNTPNVQYWYAAQLQAQGCFYVYYQPPQGGGWTTLYARPLNIC